MVWTLAPAGNAAPASDPPMAKKETKTTDIHGDTLKDDYFWLREKSNPEVRKYLEAENAYADEFMKSTEGFQKKLYDEMLARIKETDDSVPYRANGYFYYTRTEKGKQYNIFCRKKGTLAAPEEVFLDLNAMAVGRALHVRRRLGRLGRQPPHRLHDRQHGLPRLHAPRQGPHDREGPSRDGREGLERGLGRGRQDALLLQGRRRQAPVPPLPPRARRSDVLRRASLRREGRDVPALPAALEGPEAACFSPRARTRPTSGGPSRRRSRRANGRSSCRARRSTSTRSSPGATRCTCAPTAAAAATSAS